MSIFDDKAIKNVANIAARIMGESAKKANQDYDQDEDQKDNKKEIKKKKEKISKNLKWN